MVDPQAAHKVVGPSDNYDGYIVPFLHGCGVKQEVASNKAWEAKGAGSPKINKAMPMTPSVIKTSQPLRAHTIHHQQRTCKLRKSVDCESQGGGQGPAGR